MPEAQAQALRAAAPPDASGPQALPLEFLAHLLAFTTEAGSFQDLVLPLLEDCPAIQDGRAELRRLQRRYCHPSLPSLVDELSAVEAQLRQVLEAPEDAAEDLAIGEVGLEDPSGLASWALAWRLCESCVDIAARDPRRGGAVARAALAVAEHLSPYEYGVGHRRQLEALAWAHLGNTYRIPGQLRRAAKCFGEVRKRQAWQTDDMAGLWAEVRWLEITVRRDHRDLKAARLAGLESLRLAQVSDRLELVAGALLSLASLDYEEGNVDSSIQRTRQALAQLDPHQHPRWYAEACFNVATYLGRSGDGAGALEHLERYLPELRQHYSQGDLARIPWLEGVALRALGQREEAAEKYDQARRAFLELQHGPAAAVVTLELALVRLELGHTAEVKRLAAEILPVFKMEGIDREARATLELFRQAVAAEQLTLLQLRAWLGRMGVRQ